MRRLFEGGAYLRAALIKRLIPQSQNISLLQQLQGRERGRLGLSYRRSLQPSRKNWRTRTFWRENWMKEHQDILTSNWKKSLLMTVNSHCWLRTALQRLQCIFIILWKYSNKRRTGAAALINHSAPCAALNRGRRLFGGGAYSSKYGNLNFQDILSNVF